MAASTSPVLSSGSTKPTRFQSKHLLWIVLGLVALSIIPSTEIPILFDKTGPNALHRARLFHDRFLLFPHALCGVTALLSGPLQFSTRFRSRHLQFHRVLGRVYVFSVLIAASLALIIVRGRGSIQAAVCVQAGAWIICTLAAFLTARNRQIVKHRQWMIRSYAVTLTFVANRFLDFWPAYFNIATPQHALAAIIIIDTFLAIFLPEIAFSWRELTTRRVRA